MSALRLWLIPLLLLSGCAFAKYQDIGAKPEHFALINKSYSSQQEMVIHAVTLEKNYEHVVGYYSVTPKPGFGGPEVLSRQALPIGTVIRILKVEECTNCLGTRKRFVIALPNSELYSKHTVVMDASFGGVELLLNEGGKAAINPTVFAEVNK